MICFKKSSKWCFLFVIATIFFIGTSANAEGQIPRPEHPKPQFRRDAWLNLNGRWDFAMDPDVVGVKESWQSNPSKLDKKIVVPFCVESKLSGIGHTASTPTTANPSLISSVSKVFLVRRRQLKSQNNKFQFQHLGAVREPPILKMAGRPGRNDARQLVLRTTAVFTGTG